MRRSCIAVLATLAALPAAGQAVSAWPSASGVPIAVVETPGGDVEHVALVASPAGTAPDAVMGYRVEVGTVPGAQVWLASVPALLATPALQELIAAASAGAAALVALGPAPAHELRVVLGGLDSVANVRLPRPDCILADGSEAVERGSPERVELRFAAFPPADPRSVFLPALAAWLQLRLAADFPGVQVLDEPGDGCARLTLAVEAGQREPRELLHRLRSALAALADAPPTTEEARTVGAILRRRAAAWAADGAATARALAERAAAGGDVPLALGTRAVAAATLRATLDGIVTGRSGAALLVEAERRAAPPERQTLENGVLLNWRYIAGETAAVALAFGPVDPVAAADAARAIAARAATAGWTVAVMDVLGVQAVAIAAPAEDAVAVLERVAETLSAWRPPARASGEVARLLGLAPRPAAESVSVALALPVAAETATEGAVKFFADLPAGRVTAGAVAAGGTLSLTPDVGPARITATVAVPADAPGLVAGEVLVARLESTGLRARFVAPAGGVVLVLDGSADRDVPSFDAALAAAWRAARAPVTADEARAAARRLAARLYGDLLLTVAREAATPFLPALPAPVALLGAAAKDVSAALAGLPDWAALHRLARGPMPVVEPPPADMRKSPSRPPGRR